MPLENIVKIETLIQESQQIALQENECQYWFIQLFERSRFCVPSDFLPWKRNQTAHSFASFAGE